MAKSKAALALEIRDGVARLDLDRGEVHNAFDDALILELTEALKALEGDPAVRVVVLAGRGPSFSAGADLKWMKAMAKASEKDNRRDARQLAKLMRALDSLDRPTVARVRGAAFGGGVGLVACCDIAIAAEGARFGLTETRLGLVPAVISPYVLDAIGPRQARRLFMTAETFDAREAERLGLVHQCVPDDQLDAAVDRTVAHLLRAGPVAVVEAKRLARRIAQPDPKRRRELDEENADLIARIRVSPEGQEGLKAFFAKRPPKWSA